MNITCLPLGKTLRKSLRLASAVGHASKFEQFANGQSLKFDSGTDYFRSGQIEEPVES